MITTDQCHDLVYLTSEIQVNCLSNHTSDLAFIDRVVQHLPTSMVMRVLVKTDVKCPEIGSLISSQVLHSNNTYIKKLLPNLSCDDGDDANSVVDLTGHVGHVKRKSKGSKRIKFDRKDQGSNKRRSVDPDQLSDSDDDEHDDDVVSNDVYRYFLGVLICADTVEKPTEFAVRHSSFRQVKTAWRNFATPDDLEHSMGICGALIEIAGKNRFAKSRTCDYSFTHDDWAVIKLLISESLSNEWMTVFYRCVCFENNAPGLIQSFGDERCLQLLNNKPVCSFNREISACLLLLAMLFERLFVNHSQECEAVFDKLMSEAVMRGVRGEYYVDMILHCTRIDDVSQSNGHHLDRLLVLLNCDRLRLKSCIDIGTKIIEYVDSGVLKMSECLSKYCLALADQASNLEVQARSIVIPLKCRCALCCAVNGWMESYEIVSLDVKSLTLSDCTRILAHINDGAKHKNFNVIILQTGVDHHTYRFVRNSNDTVMYETLIKINKIKAHASASDQLVISDGPGSQRMIIDGISLSLYGQFVLGNIRQTIDNAVDNTGDVVILVKTLLCNIEQYKRETVTACNSLSQGYACYHAIINGIQHLGWSVVHPILLNANYNIAHKIHVLDVPLELVIRLVSSSSSSPRLVAPDDRYLIEYYSTIVTLSTDAVYKSLCSSSPDIHGVLQLLAKFKIIDDFNQNVSHCYDSVLSKFLVNATDQHLVSLGQSLVRYSACAQLESARVCLMSILVQKLTPLISSNSSEMTVTWHRSCPLTCKCQLCVLMVKFMNDPQVEALEFMSLYSPETEFVMYHLDKIRHMTSFECSRIKNSENSLVIKKKTSSDDRLSSHDRTALLELLNEARRFIAVPAVAEAMIKPNVKKTLKMRVKDFIGTKSCDVVLTMASSVFM